MKFSDTSNRDGIIQLIERDTGTQSSTSQSYPLKQKTIDVNNALGIFFLLAIKAGGRFQVDDTNQTDYPTITTALVSGQKDYVAVWDGSSTANQVLDIRQVRIKDNNGNWKYIDRIDKEVDDINQYEGITGVPTAFDVDSNGIMLYPTPNYSLSNALELYISRTPSYFVSTDTTKEAGIPKIFHSYLYLKPSLDYCLVKGLPQTKGLAEQVAQMETMIQEYYSRRDRVDKKRMTPAQQNNR